MSPNRRVDYSDAQNELLTRFGVPFDQEPVQLTNFTIEKGDMPVQLQGPMVVTHPNRKTQVSFRLNGIDAYYAGRVCNEIDQQGICTREGLLTLLHSMVTTR